MHVVLRTSCRAPQLCTISAVGYSSQKPQTFTDTVLQLADGVVPVAAARVLRARAVRSSYLKSAEVFSEAAAAIIHQSAETSS